MGGKMTEGLDGLREALKGYEDSYVIIGGTACSIILDSQGLRFRETKDIDMVLRTEEHMHDFSKALWDYIRNGHYESLEKSESKPRFYRFSKPATPNYPKIIELFSPHPDYPIADDSAVAPIHIADDIYSLSAIVLDDAYYHLLSQGKETVDGLTVLSPEFLIPFKAKAWLDLTQQKDRELHANGPHVDAKNIKKHRNDVFRLAAMLRPNTRVELDANPKNDMRDFLQQMRTEDIPLKQLGVFAPKQSLIDLLKAIYLDKD